MEFLFKHIKIGKWAIPVPAFLWFALALVAASLEMSRGLEDINNYLIYKQVFWHTLQKQNLFSLYPAEYFDANHYGPLFALLIAPFALLPTLLGCFLWCLANAAVLFYAIKQLPLSQKEQSIVLLIGAIEMMTAIHSVQFNPMLTGWMVLSYVNTQRKQDIWATFFIVAGFYIKIYSIVGVAFFFFSDNKIKFVLSGFAWLLILFCAPMLISSPAFIIQSYQDWYHSLVDKNATNIVIDVLGMQDISVMGMARRITRIGSIPNFWFTVPAAVCYLLPFLRIKQFKHIGFQLSYLALALIGVVIFSSGAESPTYVIAVTGLAIWYAIQSIPRPKWIMAILILTFLLTILSPTDLVPRFIRTEYIVKYSLKALPCFIAWSVLIFQLLFKDFDQKTLHD